MLLEARASLRLAPQGVEARARRLDMGEAQPLRWGARLVRLTRLMHLMRLARLTQFSYLLVVEAQIWSLSASHEVKRRFSLFILSQKNYCAVLFYFLIFLPFFSFFFFLLFVWWLDDLLFYFFIYIFCKKIATLMNASYLIYQTYIIFFLCR